MGIPLQSGSKSEEYNKLFKLYLDPKYQDGTGTAPDREEVHKWFRDYLRCLQRYILQYLAESQARFNPKRLEFVFSVPTTWREPAVIASVKRTTHEAGYGVSGTERASVYMIEAEAAAVYAFGSSMEYHDVFLICDAGGGGTTDVNILMVESHPGPGTAIELTPLRWSEGLATGSTLIDSKFGETLLHRLQKMQDQLDADLESIVTAMVASDTFMRAKCSFGHDHFCDRYISAKPSTWR